MTTYQPKPIQGTYNHNQNPLPSTVSIGVSLVTLETESFIQDDRHIEVPVDDDIVYLTVPREIVYLPSGGADYKKIALLAEQAGYPRRIWKVTSVWTVAPSTSNEAQPF